MKTFKGKGRKLLAAALSLLMLVGLLPVSAFAAGSSVTVTFAYLYQSDGSQIMYQDTFVGTHAVNGGAGHPAVQIYADGEEAYCIEPGEHLLTGDVLTENASEAWNSLGSAKQEAIKMALAFGKPGNSGSLTGSGDAKHLATQMIVWEFVCGYRDAASYVLLDDCIYNAFCKNGANAEVAASYNAIAQTIQTWDVIPSFANGRTYEMNYENGNYVVSLNDSNGVLGSYSVTSSDSNVKISKSGNTLTLICNSYLEAEPTITVQKSSNISASAVLVSYGSPNLQDIVVGMARIEDVSASFKVSTVGGTLKLAKNSEDSIVEGIEFTITGSGYNKGIKRPGKGKQQPPTKWNSSTITKILSLQEYCGDVLNFKTYSKSYKNKKRIDNDREDWVVFKDVHEPIIERAVYEQIQEKRGKMRKRRTNDGEKNMFSGLLVCADCGSNLHFHFNQGNPEIKYFNCSNYKGNRGTCTSTHYVRVDFLEQVVLGEIRRLTKYASIYEDEFLKEVIGHSRQAEEANLKLKEKEVKSLLARNEELDGLFERIYEDNISGKLSDERFTKMSIRYESEQKENSDRIKKLTSEIEKQSNRTTSTNMFISLVRKYTRARKLTPRMLNELVEKIEVYNAEKIDGEWVQRLRIHYNCVGEMTIPKVLPLPVPAVTVNTRKGVYVSYAANDELAG